jgi:hypothetical protein
MNTMKLMNKEEGPDTPLTKTSFIPPIIKMSHMKREIADGIFDQAAAALRWDMGA